MTQRIQYQFRAVIATPAASTYEVCNEHPCRDCDRLLVFFAVFSLLRGNWAGFFAGIAGALTLGLLSGMSSRDHERGPWDA